MNIRSILEAAIKAPSGENAQPWRFVVRGDEIEVYVDRERDVSPYSWGHRSSYVAIGAALENMRIQATEQGLIMKMVLFPANDPFLVARVMFDSETQQVDSLVAAIPKRSTNRKRYTKNQLTQSDIDALRSATPSRLKLFLATKDSDKEVLAQAGTNNERVMLANSTLHHYFFGHVSWSPKEDKEKKVGFFVKTLELPPPAVLGFKLMRSWSRARIMNKYLKMNKVVASQNAAQYAASPGIGVLISQNESAVDATEAGIALERIWLTATARGLSMQPIAGLLYLNLAVKNGEKANFTQDESKLISESYAAIQKVTGADEGYVYFMFRIGYSDEPTARSMRFSLNEVMAQVS